MELEESNNFGMNSNCENICCSNIILMYRAGLVCMHKDIIMEANKILFNFIWKGKDKVKQSTLISDVEKGDTANLML